MNEGQVLQKGKYTIERELNRGYVDITYIAKRHDGERWILKVLNSDLLSTLSSAEQDRLKTMFSQEATKLERCNKTPYIARVGMPFIENGLMYLPMEYMQGNSLAARPQPILSEEIALRYVQQIGEALCVVHRQGLVHRDIRPSNVFLRVRDGIPEAVLTNFALAIDCDTKLTRTRKYELIDGFSPIELYSRGRAIGTYTDIYELAATLYDLLTGEAPPAAEKMKAAREQGNRSYSLISPQVKNPEISGRTVKAIKAGMEFLPEKRPQSVASWLSKLDLKKASSGHSCQKESVNWTKWQALWGAVAAIVSLIVGVPAWLVIQKADTPSSVKEPTQANQPNEAGSK